MINMRSQSREATVAQSQSRSDCYPFLLIMQSHSREAIVMPPDAAKPLVTKKKRKVDSIYSDYFDNLKHRKDTKNKWSLTTPSVIFFDDNSTVDHNWPY